MVATTLADDRPSLWDTTSGDLVLRVCNSSRNGQVVRLKAAKCTIGSGSRCTLRLRARGISPLHCLILRGPTTAVVRCWSADTQLNQRSFADSVLARGDRLAIGPVELEVVSVGSCQTMATLPPVIQTPAEVPPKADPTIELQLQGMEEERRRLDELAASLQHRETSLLAQHEEANAQRNDFDAQQQAFQQQCKQWQAEQEAAKTRLDEQQVQIASQLAELKTQHDSLAEERRQWESQRTEATAQAAVHSEQMDARAAETEAVNRAIQQQREQWQAEQEEAAKQLNEQRAQIVSQLADLESQRTAMAEERQQLEAQRAELRSTPAAITAASESAAEAEPTPAVPPQELQFEAPPEAAPVDLAAVFRRIGAKVEQEEEPALPEPMAPAERPLDMARPRASAAASAHDEGEEESVDAYMSRLMQRIRSTSGDAGTSYSATQSSEPARAPRETPKTDTAEEAPPSVPAPSSHESQPVEMSPRTVAPENRTDLSTLRELANLSAQSAIRRYSRQVLVNTAYSKLLVAAVALIAGGALLWMWKDFGALQMTFYSALAALLVAIYWGVEYALLTGRLIISKSGHIDIDWNSSPHRKSAASPGENAVQEYPDVGAEPAPEVILSAAKDLCRHSDSSLRSE